MTVRGMKTIHYRTDHVVGGPLQPSPDDLATARQVARHSAGVMDANKRRLARAAGWDEIACPQCQRRRLSLAQPCAPCGVSGYLWQKRGHDLLNDVEMAGELAHHRPAAPLESATAGLHGVFRDI